MARPIEVGERAAGPRGGTASEWSAARGRGVQRIAEAGKTASRRVADALTSEEALAVLDQVLQATVKELDLVDVGNQPTAALFVAASHMLDAVVAGDGVISLQRFLAMIDAIASSDSMGEQVSAMRRHQLTEGLARRMGRDPGDPEVSRATTLWSAIMRTYYVGIRHTPDEYLPLHDAHLHAFANARLAEIFHQVMGKAAPAISLISEIDPALAEHAGIKRTRAAESGIICAHGFAGGCREADRRSGT